MKAKDFWDRYVGEYTPAEFMARYQSRNPRRCAERYVSRLPSMYGIVRQRTWRKTFIAPVQHVRDSVVAGLTAYLEQTRPEWEQALAERAEREQADWEQAERERLEREQADWERAQQPIEPPTPTPVDGMDGLLDTASAPTSVDGIPEAAPAVEAPPVSAAPPAISTPISSDPPNTSETGQPQNVQ